MTRRAMATQSDRSLTSLFLAHFSTTSNEFVSVYERELTRQFRQLVPNLQVLCSSWYAVIVLPLARPATISCRVDNETWIVLLHIATWLGFDTALERHVETRFRASFIPSTHHLGCLHTLAAPAAPAHPVHPRAGRISRWALFVQPNPDLFWATAAQALLPSEPYPRVHAVYAALVSALVGQPSSAPPYGRHHPAWRGGLHTDDGSGALLLAGMPRDVLRHHVVPRLGSADLHAAMSVCHAWCAALCAVVHAATCLDSATPAVLPTIARLTSTMPALHAITLHGSNWTMDPHDCLSEQLASAEQLCSLTVHGLTGSTLQGWQVRFVGCFVVHFILHIPRH